MKNNLIISILICFFSIKLASAQSFKFETNSIDIEDGGNLILATKGKAYSLDNDLEVSADKFEFQKNKQILNVFNNGFIIINSKNLQIKFDEAIIDQKTKFIKAIGNVQIKELDLNLKINADEIFYDQKTDLIKSEMATKITDKLGNIYIADNFNYEISKNILKISNLIFKDLENNTLKTSLAYFNTKTNRLFGKDVEINLSNKSFDKNNEPRLKGNSITNDDEISEITKGVFTTCKRRDGCPPWQMSAEKIKHDKKSKTINYKNALLKIYDIPVMYFPKFFHPDPTVKRRSGFLIPTIKNSPTSDNYLSVPYFFAIAENKDATFSPRLYTKNKILLQTEYRQINSDSNHISDISYFAENNKNSKSHIFYDYDRNLNLKNFSDGKLNVKIQKTSNDTYLKTNKIKSNLITDNDTLENTLGINLYSNDLSIDMETKIYENLNKNNNDRFEYIIPKINLVKKIDNNTNLNGDMSFKSQNLIRNYDTNIFEKSNVNDFIFSSFPKLTGNGFYNNYEILIKNSNTDSQNSENFKEDQNIYLTSLFQYNSTLPLVKDSEKNQKIMKPKISLKIAPGHTKNDEKKEAKVDVNNIYSLNRVTDNDSVEGGISLAYGTEYSIFNKVKSRETINFKFANNLRLKKNDDLPKKNQIGNKTSNFFSEISYSPNEIFKTEYKSALRNNLSEMNSENLITEFKINNFVTTFDYLNENGTTEKNSYLTNKTKYSFDESNSFSFSTRENKTENLTEYYNLMYQYKNDCLAASIEYNKDYYTDRDLKPVESIFFKLTIIPFGETSSPNLKN